MELNNRLYWVLESNINILNNESYRIERLIQEIKYNNNVESLIEHLQINEKLIKTLKDLQQKCIDKEFKC